MPLIKTVTKLPDIKADSPPRWQDSEFTRMEESYFWAKIWTLPVEILEAIALWKRHVTIDWRDAQAYVEQNRPTQTWTNLPVDTILEVIGTRRGRTHMVGHTYRVVDPNGYVVGVFRDPMPEDWSAWQREHEEVIFLPYWKVRIVSLPGEEQIVEGNAEAEPLLDYPVPHFPIFAPPPDESPVQTAIRQQQIADSFEFV